MRTIARVWSTLTLVTAAGWTYAVAVPPAAAAESPAAGPARLLNTLPPQCLTTSTKPANARPAERTRAQDAAAPDRNLRRSKLTAQGMLGEVYQDLLKEFCATKDAGDKARLAGELARNREAVGDLEVAVWFSERSLEYTERDAHVSAGPWSALEASFALSWVPLYVKAGDMKAARQRISVVEEHLKRRTFNSPVEEAVASRALIDAYITVGDFGHASRMLKTSARAVEKSVVGTLGPQADPSKLGQQLASIMRGISDVQLAETALRFARAREFGEAARLAAQASADAKQNPVTINGVTVPPFTAAEAGAVASLGLGDGAAALKYLQEWNAAVASGKDTLRAIGVLNVEALVSTRHYAHELRRSAMLGQAYALLGRPAEAAAAYLDAIRTIENLRGLVQSDDRLGFFGEYASPYAGLATVLLKQGSRLDATSLSELKRFGGSPEMMAAYYTESARARSLSERIGAMSVSTIKVPDAVQRREQLLRARATGELQRGVPFTDSAAYREFMSFVGDLRTSQPAYADLRYPMPAPLESLRLRRNEVLLTFLLLEDEAVVWRVQPGRPPETFRHGISRGRVLERIAAVKQSLTKERRALDPPPFDVAAARDLYAWLLDKPLRGMPKDALVVAVPDPELASVPLEALVASTSAGRPRYAGEQHSFVYVPSATFFERQRATGSQRRRAGPMRVLALGDPIHNERDDRVAGTQRVAATAPETRRAAAIASFVRDGALPPLNRLEWAADEIAGIKRALAAQRVDTRLGDDADEQWLKASDLSVYSHLHFATHGVVDTGLPYMRQPALVLRQLGDLRGEDGWLTEGEIVGLNVAADLTVLSACDTGRGRYTAGEGVMSLARAFLYAGSRSVIMSLWAANDQATSKLMTALYGELALGKAPFEALKAARESIRGQQGNQRFAHPYYWAAFVLYGEAS